VLTSPADTGAVTLSLPQDTQTEAHDYPVEFFNKRIWHIPRNRADSTALAEAAKWISESQCPLIIAGGGVIYSGAEDALKQFVEKTGIPVGVTMAGKGSLLYDNKLNLGAIGVTGNFAANRIAREATWLLVLEHAMAILPRRARPPFRILMFVSSILTLLNLMLLSILHCRYWPMRV